jgi:phosphoglucomutase
VRAEFEKALVSSQVIHRLTEKLERKIYEAPVGQRFAGC